MSRVRRQAGESERGARETCLPGELARAAARAITLFLSQTCTMALSRLAQSAARQGLLPASQRVQHAAFSSASEEPLSVEVSTTRAEGARRGRAADQCRLTQVLPFKAHKIEPPSNMVETSLKELTSFYEIMYKMRRMEIAADMMYKAKLIRGFCHL